MWASTSRRTVSFLAKRLRSKRTLLRKSRLRSLPLHRTNPALASLSQVHERRRLHRARQGAGLRRRRAGRDGRGQVKRQRRVCARVPGCSAEGRGPERKKICLPRLRWESGGVKRRSGVTARARAQKERRRGLRYRNVCAHAGRRRHRHGQPRGRARKELARVRGAGAA